MEVNNSLKHQKVKVTRKQSYQLSKKLVKLMSCNQLLSLLPSIVQKIINEAPDEGDIGRKKQMEAILKYQNIESTEKCQDFRNTRINNSSSVGFITNSEPHCVPDLSIHTESNNAASTHNTSSVSFESLFNEILPSNVSEKSMLDQFYRYTTEAAQKSVSYTRLPGREPEQPQLQSPGPDPPTIVEDLLDDSIKETHRFDLSIESTGGQPYFSTRNAVLRVVSDEMNRLDNDQTSSMATIHDSGHDRTRNGSVPSSNMTNRLGWHKFPYIFSDQVPIHNPELVHFSGVRPTFNLCEVKVDTYDDSICEKPSLDSRTFEQVISRSVESFSKRQKSTTNTDDVTVAHHRHCIKPNKYCHGSAPSGSLESPSVADEVTQTSAVPDAVATINQKGDSRTISRPRVKRTSSTLSKKCGVLFSSATLHEPDEHHRGTCTPGRGNKARAGILRSRTREECLVSFRERKNHSSKPVLTTSAISATNHDSIKYLGVVSSKVVNGKFRRGWQCSYKLCQSFNAHTRPTCNNCLNPRLCCPPLSKRDIFCISCGYINYKSRLYCKKCHYLFIKPK